MNILMPSFSTAPTALSAYISCMPLSLYCTLYRKREKFHWAKLSWYSHYMNFRGNARPGHLYVTSLCKISLYGIYYIASTYYFHLDNELHGS